MKNAKGFRSSVKGEYEIGKIRSAMRMMSSEAYNVLSKRTDLSAPLNKIVRILELHKDYKKSLAISNKDKLTAFYQ